MSFVLLSVPSKLCIICNVTIKETIMAFDGITVSAIAYELNTHLAGGKINKIAQPEPDELLITIKNNRTTYRLLLSASASLPLVYLTDQNRPSPLNAPNFCMLLRKHIGSARILSVEQPSMERILILHLEHRDELGDLRTKKLIIEVMGKHSNIIFCDEENKILDSIKHISSSTSSVREVLPGRIWFIPNTMNKKDPLLITEEDFYQTVCTRPQNVTKALYTTLTGLSPQSAEEICYRAGIDGGFSAESLSEPERIHLYHTFLHMMDDIREHNYSYETILKKDEPIEFSAFHLTQYDTTPELHTEHSETISQVLMSYYSMRDKITRIRQKSADLRKIVNTALERNVKKYELQKKQMKDTDKKEKYRIYGELLNTYGYSAEPGAKSLTCLNYYTNEELTIPLDPQLSATENAKKYFDRYGKLKRTDEALRQLLDETEQDIRHLESIATSLDIALNEEDLVEVREELIESGYLKRKGPVNKKQKITSKPFHYVSSDGYDIYVGKNNFQNEYLSFKFASGNDMWFHAKGLPGSHVIVKSKGVEIPDRTYEEAASLAAFYSKARQSPKVEIDYTVKKNLRKPNGSKPGFVVYYTNYSMVAEPNISHIKEA